MVSFANRNFSCSYLIYSSIEAMPLVELLFDSDGFVVATALELSLLDVEFASSSGDTVGLF